jgi:outer membrane protein TolC
MQSLGDCRYNLTAILQDEQRHLASSARLEALAALMPQVGGTMRESVQVLNTASFGFTFPGLPTLLGPFTLFDARVAMSAPVFDPMALAELRHERANERAVEADYRSVRETVILAVGNLYLQVVAIRRAWMRCIRNSPPPRHSCSS